jgi:hypothetical protein
MLVSQHILYLDESHSPDSMLFDKMCHVKHFRLKCDNIFDFEKKFSELQMMGMDLGNQTKNLTLKFLQLLRRLL